MTQKASKTDFANKDILAAALAEDAHVIGLSILSGSHIPLVEEVLRRMKEADISHIPLIVGGIIPEEDSQRLQNLGVSKIYTPKDFELNTIMMDIVSLVDPGQIAAQ